MRSLENELNDIDDDEDIEITFLLPEGIAVSAPWKPVAASGGQAVFRTGRSPCDWPASVAFGRFKEKEIRVGGARLRLAVLDGTPAADVEQVPVILFRIARAHPLQARRIISQEG